MLAIYTFYCWFPNSFTASCQWNFVSIAARSFRTPLVSRVANRPGFPGTVPELACGVPCPGQGRFFPGIFHKVLQYDTLRYEMQF